MAEKLRTYTDRYHFSWEKRTYPTLTIPERVITAVCTGCDYFKGDGVPCHEIGSEKQAEFAASGWCGRARVDGKFGQKFAGKFYPNRRNF